nr:maltose ABC transporter substrate-binding protein [Geodermatophilaceae bacterium]
APDTGAGSTDSTDSSAAGGDASLVIWADELRANVLRPFAEQFGEANGITVDVQQVDNAELQANFITAANAGEGPDIIISASDQIGNYVQNGVIAPITLNAEQQALFQPIAIQGVTYNDQIYALPYAVENIALFRNTDLVPDAPATLEDLATAGKALVDAGTVTNSLALQVGQNGDAYHMEPLFTSAGGYLFGQDESGAYDPTDLGLAQPAAAAALTKIQQFAQTGALSTAVTPDNAISLFAEGQAPFLVSGPWAVNTIKEAGLSYEIAPVPPFAGGDVARPFVGVQSFLISSKGANQAFAEEFVLNFVGQDEEVALALFDAEPRPSALLSAFEQESASDPDIAAFGAAAADGQIIPSIPEMAAVWGPLGIAQAAAVNGDDPTTAIEAAATAIQDAIAG